MKGKNIKTFLIILGLIAATCVVMANAEKWTSEEKKPVIISRNNGTLSIQGNLVRDKILVGKDNSVSLSLDLQADRKENLTNGPEKNVDMVVVLDRSGSMQGRKIEDARNAVKKLLSELNEKDRFALISYSNQSIRHMELKPVNEGNRRAFLTTISMIHAGGGTNLGEGLRMGLETVKLASRTGNIAKVILISDGLANQGIVDPGALSNMAATAVKNEFSVSTVGVGANFNEVLMTAIADQGSGNYYFLENPDAFASVFMEEFHLGRTVAVSGVEIRVPLKDGMTFMDAGGYPFRLENNHAILNIGNLSAGEKRKLFLTFRVPSDKEREFDISGISVLYSNNGEKNQLYLDGSFHFACVPDPHAAMASIDADEWEKKVIHKDFNQLKEEIASDIRKGDKAGAMARIQGYESRQASMNQTVQSAAVAKNLEEDVASLRDQVTETFEGGREEVARKQKIRAKSLQYEGYKGQRKTK